MLRNKKRISVKPALKVFPRLAVANAPPKIVRLDRSAGGGRDSAAATLTAREAEAMRVRAQLLQMILDNERTRRNDWRPSAS
jgi:c-di-GMP-binding flagellar brake protein YcgR